MSRLHFNQKDTIEGQQMRNIFTTCHENPHTLIFWGTLDTPVPVVLAKAQRLRMELMPSLSEYPADIQASIEKACTQAHKDIRDGISVRQRASHCLVSDYPDSPRFKQLPGQTDALEELNK